MSSDNILLKYIQVISSCKDDYDLDIKKFALNRLIDIAKNTPLEFTCTVAQAFSELELEFDKQRKALHNAIGQVVIEMVKQGHASPKKV
jgi:hypothetical protein